MPNTLEIDPKKGFIALPMAVFDLDLTPGAFRTLAELCRMANLEGQCWPSLGQLGERLNRSRAAVSGYIAELRTAELIETETQKMSNGYNYRLRYRIVFWKEWRKKLGQSTERRVQPVERPLKTKNHNHINQSPAQAGNSELLDAWKSATGRVPYPAFEHWPSEAVVEQSRKAIAAAPSIISVDIISLVNAFLAEQRIEALQLSPQERSALQGYFDDGRDAEAFIQGLKQTWKPHWQQPPGFSQLERLLRKLPANPTQTSEAKLLKSYLNRLSRYSQGLPLHASTGKVAA